MWKTSFFRAGRLFGGLLPVLLLVIMNACSGSGGTGNKDDGGLPDGEPAADLDTGDAGDDYTHGDGDEGGEGDDSPGQDQAGDVDGGPLCGSGIGWEIASGQHWADWSVATGVVFQGQNWCEVPALEPYLDCPYYGGASDPTVIADSGGYRMIYTCHGGFGQNTCPALAGQETLRTALCLASSPDGRNWTRIGPLSSPEGLDGLVLAGRTDQWDQALETAFLLKTTSGYRLFYSGYDDCGGIFGTEHSPAALAVADSTDGVHFTRLGAGEPALVASSGWYDDYDVFSPAVVDTGEVLFMVYAGHCWFARCHRDRQGVYLLGAVSRDGGESWQKLQQPLLGPRDDVYWLRVIAAEPDLLRGPDGYYYLFISGEVEQERKVTGIARAQDICGPWQLNPEPILLAGSQPQDACGAFAPAVVIDGDRVRMWYLGVDDCGGTCPSCDYENCSCSPAYSILYAEAPWPLYR